MFVSVRRGRASSDAITIPILYHECCYYEDIRTRSELRGCGHARHGKINLRVTRQQISCL